MRTALLLVVLIGTAAPGARAAGFVVRPGADQKVVFVSQAPLERFEGRTRHLEGRIEVDPARLGDSLEVHLEVDLTTLDTGLRKRNEHMRERHLETARFPRAVFHGATLLRGGGSPLGTGVPTAIEAEGSFTLHGVTRRQRVAGSARRTAAGAIAFDLAFTVRLGDHAIPRPEFLFLKLAEGQEVRVQGVAVPAP